MFEQFLLSILPKSLISYATGVISTVYLPHALRGILYNWYIKAYGVNDKEIELETNSYENFRSFFTRKLKSGARKIASSHLVSPVDGLVLSNGNYENNTLVQIKGFEYTIKDLLNDSSMFGYFNGQGSYCTYYLAPGDYHRIHSPVDGNIVSRLYVPGNLFPVNDFSRRHVKNLYTRNERVVTCIDAGDGEYVAVVKVAALNVGQIGLAYDESYLKDLERYKQFQPKIKISKGDELGVFYLGSTVIVISNRLNAFRNKEFDIVKMGMGD